MRIFTTIMALVLCTLPVQVDAKCKFGTKKPNHVETKLIQLKSKLTKAINFKFGNVEGQYYLIVNVHSIGKRYEFDAETPLEIFLANDKSLLLTPAEPEKAHRTIMGLAINYKQSNTYFNVEKEVFEKLRTVAISGVDLHYKHKGKAGIEAFSVGGRAAKRAMEYVGCALEYEILTD